MSELNKLLVNVAKSNYLVQDAFVGDVYTINGKENRFGCFVATPLSAVKQSVGLLRYTYVLYYIDRLTKAEDTIDYVQSDAVYVLAGVVNYIEEQGLEVDTGYECLCREYAHPGNGTTTGKCVVGCISKTGSC